MKLMLTLFASILIGLSALSCQRKPTEPPPGNGSPPPSGCSYSPLDCCKLAAWQWYENEYAKCSSPLCKALAQRERDQKLTRCEEEHKDAH